MTSPTYRGVYWVDLPLKFTVGRETYGKPARLYVCLTKNLAGVFIGVPLTTGVGSVASQCVRVDDQDVVWDDPTKPLTSESSVADPVQIRVVSNERIKGGRQGVLSQAAMDRISVRLAYILGLD